MMKKPLPILYSFRRCPYAMRARFALAYSGLQCEVREVDLKNKPQALLDISPKGTVPVLLLSDGTRLEESMDIIQHSLAHHDPDGWGAQDSDAAQRIITKNDTEFVPILRKYKYHERHPSETKEAYLQQAESVFLLWLEDALHANRYVLGDTLSRADIAIFPFIRQFALADKAWFDTSPYAKIREWLQGLIDNPLYDIIMKKSAPWQPSDNITTLL